MGVNVVWNGLVVMRMTIRGKATHIALRHEVVSRVGEATPSE
jgi:hypothetical protein